MKRLLGAFLALLALTVFPAGCAQKRPEARSAAGELRVTFLDVGKGDCILLEKDGSFALIDAGYEDTAQATVAFLKARGVETLDAFIVTHYDKDHVGGAAAVAQAFAVKQLYLPGYEGSGKRYTALMRTVVEQELAYLQVKEDVSFSLSGVTVAIFASPLAYENDGTGEGNDNDVSLVVSAKYGADSYLFAGDLEKAGIAAYLSADRGTFDVVKMPHHGSHKKNTDEFIAAVQPKIAVITDSAGEPADPKTLDLLTQAGASVYRTALEGTVTVCSTGTGAYTAG